MPPPGASMTISVWTVPAVSVTGRLVFALGPVALMVQVPGGIGACGLTLPGAAAVGVVRLLSMTLSCPCWALVRSGTTVYAPPALTVRLTDQTGLLDAEDPAARILTL